MRIIITEKQIKYLKSKFIFESDEVNQYGFTIDEMNQIEEFVKNNVRSYYEWLKNEVEKGKEYVSSMKKLTSSGSFKSDMEVYSYIIKEFKQKIKDYEINKKNLENFNFEEKVKKAIEQDIYGGANTMSYNIRYKKYEEEALNRTLTKNNIIDLFVTSLEGGSNYWYYMDLPDNIKTYGQSTSEAVGEYILQGGEIYFYDVEEYENVVRNKKKGEYNIQGDLIDQKSYKEDLDDTYLGYVDMDKVLESIPIIKKDYPEIWERILLEQADAGDADVFLQLCVMGEVVYGGDSSK
jgi:hypothetical protein